MKNLLRKILLSSPSAKGGYLIFNLFGYSIFKSLFFNLYEIIMKKIRSQKVDLNILDIKKELEEKGYCKINNFLSDKDFNDLVIQLDHFVNSELKDYKQSFSLPLMTILNNKFKSKILEKYFCNQSQIYKLVNYMSGLKSKLNPTIEYNFIKSKNNINKGFDDGQHLLHYDVTYSSFKAILYIDDTYKKNGAFEYLKGSHQFTFDRLIKEYLNSISSKRETLTNLSKKKLQNVISVEGKKNTLVIMNGKGMHRRGLFYEDTERRAVFVDYRFLHSFANLIPYKILKKIKNKELA